MIVSIPDEQKPGWLADFPPTLDLWVSFRNAPDTFSRVDAILERDGQNVVWYAPSSYQPLDAVAAVRVGPEGEVHAVEDHWSDPAPAEEVEPESPEDAARRAESAAVDKKQTPTADLDTEVP